MIEISKIYLKQIRIYHWIKNLLLFAPLVFAKRFLFIDDVISVVLGFLAFSFIASFIYVINDLVDRDLDQLHPIKKNRPFADGKISLKNMYLLLIILILLTVILSYNLPFTFQIILLVYLVFNFLYSFLLKKIVVLDIIMVAFMYLIRVYAGSAILEVNTSSWIQLVTFSLALYLVTSKRYSEFKSQKSVTRNILSKYTKELLELFIGISLSITIIFYCLFAVEKSSHFVLTIPLVVYGLFRYAYLVFYSGFGEEPEKILVKDLPLVLSGMFWVIVSLIIILIR